MTSEQLLDRRRCAGCDGGLQPRRSLQPLPDAAVLRRPFQRSHRRLLDLGPLTLRRLQPLPFLRANRRNVPLVHRAVETDDPRIGLRRDRLPRRAKLHNRRHDLTGRQLHRIAQIVGDRGILFDIRIPVVPEIHPLLAGHVAEGRDGFPLPDVPRALRPADRRLNRRGALPVLIEQLNQRHRFPCRQIGRSWGQSLGPPMHRQHHPVAGADVLDLCQIGGADRQLDLPPFAPDQDHVTRLHRADLVSQVGGRLLIQHRLN